jgi:hypothetical protein
MDNDTRAALKRIESALYAIAQSQDKLVGLLTEDAEQVEAEETDLDGNRNGGERDPKDPL